MNNKKIKFNFENDIIDEYNSLLNENINKTFEFINLFDKNLNSFNIPVQLPHSELTFSTKYTSLLEKQKFLNYNINALCEAKYKISFINSLDQNLKIFEISKEEIAKNDFEFDTLGQIVNDKNNLEIMFMIEFKYKKSSTLSRKIDILRAYSFVKNHSNMIQPIVGTTIILDSGNKNSDKFSKKHCSLSDFENKKNNKNEFSNYINDLVSFMNNYQGYHHKIWSIYNNPSTTNLTVQENYNLKNKFIDFIIFLSSYLNENLSLISQIDFEEYKKHVDIYENDFMNLFSRYDNFILKLKEEISNLNFSLDSCCDGKEKYKKIKEEFKKYNKEKNWYNDGLICKYIDDNLVFLFLILDSLLYSKNIKSNNIDNHINDLLYFKCCDVTNEEKKQKYINRLETGFKLVNEMNFTFDDISIIFKYIISEIDFYIKNINKYNEYKRNKNFLYNNQKKIVNQLLAFVLMYFFDIDNYVEESIVNIEKIRKSYFKENENEYLFYKESIKKNGYDFNLSLDSFYYFDELFKDFISKFSEDCNVMNFIDIDKQLEKINNRNKKDIIEKEMREFFELISKFNYYLFYTFKNKNINDFSIDQRNDKWKEDLIYNLNNIKELSEKINQKIEEWFLFYFDKI